MKNKDILEIFLKAGAFLSFGALIITVMLQVITRFWVPGVTLVWTEEGSRFLFKVALAFGAPLAMKHEEYVNVDIILNMLSRRARNIFEIIIHITTVGLFFIVLKESFTFVRIGLRHKSPTLGFSMSIAHATISVASFFILIYAIVNLYLYLQDLKKRGGVA